MIRNVHSQCGKRVSPLKQGESMQAISDMGVCIHCAREIKDGEYYVQRDYSANPAPMTPTDPQAISKALIPAMLDGMKKILPEMLKREFSGKVDELGEQILKNFEHRTSASAKEILDQIAKQVAGIKEPVRLQFPNLPTVDAGVQHKRFPLLMKALVAGTNVWLAGPSGSGKTTAAMNAAEVLKLPFRYTGAVGDAYSLMGFKSATGEYIRTPFREAWEHGGLFLWDEIDASDANALLAFNAALANSACAFPDGIIKKHPNCLIVAAANTWGHGATNDYVGRNKIDGAFLKRFSFISWDYDEGLETATCSNKEWCAHVQEVRRKVAHHKMRVLVTPRETYTGERLLAAGCTFEETEEMTIRAGMTEEQWLKCKPLPLPGKKEEEVGTKIGHYLGPSIPF